MTLGPSAARQLGNRLEFESLISDVSSRLINPLHGEVDHEIKDVLRRVCELLDVELAVLWQWSSSAPETARPTHFWCIQEDWRPDETMHDEQYPWARQQMLAGRMFTISSLQDFPPEAAVDRESCRQFGIQSGLCLPLMVWGEPPIGALSFNDLKASRKWPDLLLKRLQLIAQIIAGALARRRSDESLRSSEEINRATFEQAAVGIGHVGTDGRWLRVNDRLCAIHGHPREEMLCLTMQDCTHPEDLDAAQDYMRAALSGEIDGYSIEQRIVHKDRSLAWINLAVSLVRTAAGEPRHFIAVVQDITEKKRVDDELRDLSRRLISAHEDERALLARELHDDVTQRLAVLAIQVGRAELAVPDGAHAAAMQAVREELVRLSEDVHSLAYQLHPAVLRELGLTEALRTECERRGRQGQFAISLSIDPLPPDVGMDTALCLFRVAQEALNNVTRHAGAQDVRINLRRLDGGLCLAVRDDGAGFQHASLIRKAHLGLDSMRERVRAANGRFEIESAPGRGTTITVWVPLQGEAR